MIPNHLELWKELYEACKDLRKLNPWEFHRGEEIIIIKDPLTEQLGYCIIEEDQLDGTLSLSILTGQQGLAAYFESLNFDIEDLEDMDFTKSILNQEGFKIVYGSKDELFIEDYEHIQSVGISFKGKSHWPVIRRLFSGSRPWLLESKSDIMLLTTYLRRLQQILIEIDSGTIECPATCYLMSSYHDGIWQIEYVDKDDLLIEENRFIYSNELKAHRVKKLPKQMMILEGHQFYINKPFWNEITQREVFPLMTTFVDQQTGEVYLAELSQSTKEELEQTSDRLAQLLIDQLKARPCEMIVSDERIFDLISDFCERVDIDCHIGPTRASEKFMFSFIGNQTGQLEGEEQVLLQLIEAAEQAYRVMLETELGDTLSTIEKAALKDIWIYSVLFMYKEFNELPGSWSKDGFESLLQSKLLEDSVKKEYQPYLVSSIKSYLKCQQDLGLFKNAFVLTHVLAKYYY